MRNERIGMRRQIIFLEKKKVEKIHTCIPQWMGISKAWMKSTIFLKCCHWNSYKGKPHNRCVLEKLAWTCCIQVTLKINEWNYNCLFSNTVFENPQKCLIWMFQFWHFIPILVVIKLTCLVTLFDRYFDWDFFWDFQTPCVPTNFEN